MRLLLAVLLALILVPSSLAANSVTLHHREKRQLSSLHKYQGTIRFFRHHHKLAITSTGKREVRRAHAWIKIIRHELYETRTELRLLAQKANQSMASASASWYGPGLYGNNMACGGVLTGSTMGVANKEFPCGTMVTVCLDKCVTVPVVDRGPYVSGRMFDLTAATAGAVGLSGVQTIRYCVC